MILAQIVEDFVEKKWSSIKASEPMSPLPGTPRSDAGSAIAHGPFAAEVEKVSCPVRETFDWTDVRGIRNRPIRRPVEQNWHADVTRAQYAYNPEEGTAAPPFPLPLRGGRCAIHMDGTEYS